jgi:Partial alpha/beta-hydrolase lipase region
LHTAAEPEEGASRTYRSQRLRRSASFSAYETLHGVWTAKDVIQSAGYPMEPHIVTTSDGYIMQMERIPRRGELYDTLDGSRDGFAVTSESGLRFVVHSVDCQVLHMAGCQLQATTNS